MNLISRDKLNCPDLTRLRYQFDDVGYCSIGQDYNCKRITVEMVPGKGVPDYDEVTELVRRHARRCLSASTEERTQILADEFFDLFKPEYLRLTSVSRNQTLVDYTVEVEKHG